MGHSVEFRPFRFDFDGAELRRGGKKIELEAKAARLLAHLIRHRERMVSKAELLDAVWPDAVVTASSLTTCINKARAALGARGAEIIKSYYGRGYRFTAECQELPTTAKPFSSNAIPKAPFVDRVAELQVLDRALRQANGGRGTFCLIDGERGIGKSRLLEEIEARAHAAGTTTIVSRCSARSSDHRASAIIQIVSSLARRPELAALSVPEHGRSRDVLTALKRTARARLPTSRHALFQLFDDVAAVLRAQATPCAILIDNADEADEASLSFVAFLARDIARLPLLLVATADLNAPRTQASRSEEVKQLALLAHTQRLSLTALSPRDATALLTHLADAPTAEAARRWIAQNAEGNPWLLHSLVSALAATPFPGAITFEMLPEPVRSWLNDRVAGVTTDCRALLARAASSGRDIDVRILARDMAKHAGRKQSECAEIVLQTLEEAVHGRLVDAPSTTTSTYRFAHPLFVLALQRQPD